MKSICIYNLKVITRPTKTEYESKFGNLKVRRQKRKKNEGKIKRSKDFHDLHTFHI